MNKLFQLGKEIKDTGRLCNKHRGMLENPVFPKIKQFLKNIWNTDSLFRDWVKKDDDEERSRKWMKTFYAVLGM